jgi:hypothetical protein
LFAHACSPYYFLSCLHTHTQEAVKALNQRFKAWVVDQVKQHPGVSLAENALEYLTYVSQLDARYLRKQGEVFTVRASGVVLVGEGEEG